MEDTYHTLAEATTYYLKEKGSKFYGFAFPISNIEDFEIQLDKIKKEHHKASHHCFAYRIGDQQLIFRSSDDGEPAGTAGAPILGQIDSLGLTDLAVIVVRYFGGTKLGASGLIKTYRLTAKETLNQGKIIQKIRYQYYLLKFEYVHLNKVMAFLKDKQLDITKQEMTQDAQIVIGIPQSQAIKLIIELKAIIAEEYIDNMDLNSQVNGFMFEKINQL